jgi:hypothetical protein
VDIGIVGYGVPNSPQPSIPNPPKQVLGLKSLQKKLREVALGFSYSYACLIAYEVDYAIVNDNNLLPCDASGAFPLWTTWKALVRELLANVDSDSIHPRFRRVVLRLAWLNIVHRFSQLPPSTPYYGT